MRLLSKAKLGQSRGNSTEPGQEVAEAWTTRAVGMESRKKRVGLRKGRKYSWCVCVCV